MANPIRDYRSKHGLTLQQFGDLIGRQKAAVCKYENGISPSLRTAVAIERATGGEIMASALVPTLASAEPAGAAA